MSRGRYELSTRARVDLLELWDYVARESGFPDRADSLVLRIRGVCQQIADFPGIGTRREELAPGIRFFPVPPLPNPPVTTPSKFSVWFTGPATCPI